MGKVETARAEVTAIISILSRNYHDAHRFEQAQIDYTIHLSFVGATILPPYLPHIEQHALRIVRDDIIESMGDLGRHYKDCFSDLELSELECRSILRQITQIGIKVAKYLPDFESVLKSLAKSNVQNIIIHTDDFAIPWTWAHYYLEEELRPEPQVQGFEMLPSDFLANRYPCGILLVDAQAKALERWEAFSHDLYRCHTDINLLGSLHVCLLQGVLGKKEFDQKVSRAYIRHFKQIFQTQFSDDNISCHSYPDWRRETGDPERFVSDFLVSRVKSAKILHYSGHIDKSELRFDESTKVSPGMLAKWLGKFEQSPLVVLHGCSSGLVVDMHHKDKQLPTVFLDKGASGCLVALLPVDIPMMLSKAPESMIDLFYRKVMQMKTYGKALIEARQEFQLSPKTKHNPQWLFFNLYGDPRAMLITTSGSAILRRIQHFEDMIDESREQKKPPVKQEGRLMFGNLKDQTLKDELLDALRDDGAKEISQISPRMTLGLEEVLVSDTAIEVYKVVLEIVTVPFAKLLYTRIQKYLRTRGQWLRKVELAEIVGRHKAGDLPEVIGLPRDPTAHGGAGPVVIDYYEIVTGESDVENK